MPANKTNLSTPYKEKSSNGIAAGAPSKKKKRTCVKHKKNYKQYLQLHSEYRSTYTWHEYTGPHQEHTVVRRAPQPPPTSTKQASAKLQSAKSTEDENSEGPTLEPPLPRRKKCPELAYKTHEFITAADGGGIDAVDSNLVADKVREVTATSALPPSQLSKAISRISTEYRLQFAWPRRAQLANGDAVAAVNIAGGAVPTSGPPRKSLSMGALKQGIAPTGPAPVHKKRPGDIDHKRDGIQASELEPLVGTDTLDGVVPEADEREDDTSDLKITFRGKKSGGRTVRIMDGEEKVTNVSQEKPFPTSEVIELRRLADEYKHRDWGCGLAAEDEASLWKRVSSNHALNALSLARSVTKEEKEKENTRKIAPVPTTVMMPPAGRPSSVQARPIHGILQDESKDNEKAIARARKDFLIRHHLDRTTGVGKLYEGDGALLPSPTREKLEPVIPRRREDSKEHREEIQPRTKSSPKNSPRTGRSQSLGPSIAERRSPKRQPPRTPSVAKDVKEKDKDIKDKDREQREKSSERERHPRPTFLATTAPSHRPLHHVKPSVPTKTATTIISTAILNSTSTTVKPPIKHAIHTAVHHPPSSLPTSSAVDAAAAAIPSNRVTVIGKVADVVVSAGTGAVVGAAARPDRVKDLNRSQDQNEGQTKVASGHSLATAAVSTVADSSKSYSNSRYVSNKAATAVKAMTAEPQINGDVTGGESSAASTPPSQTRPIPAAPPVATSPWIDDEPVVKSPPEPTRVKSPEQMIMRSPEPVNWTVPLDTGKTFTVTQNVREEPLTRPHSEAKTWAPSSVPSAPQSAPPELAAQHKSQHSGYKSPESESVSLGSFSGINEQKDPESEGDSPFPLSSYVKESATPGTITPISAPASLQDEKESIVTDPDSKRQYRQEPLVKPVAGTNLKCLEDPVFEFERKSDVLPPTTTTGITTPTSTSVGQQQGYRVLEAEPYQGGTNAGVAGRNGVSEVGGMVSNMGGGYHVLEAPSVQTPVGPGTAQRSTASDVLEKARNRFDKFWGKGNGAEN